MCVCSHACNIVWQPQIPYKTASAHTFNSDMMSCPNHSTELSAVGCDATRRHRRRSRIQLPNHIHHWQHDDDDSACCWAQPRSEFDGTNTAGLVDKNYTSERAHSAANRRRMRGVGCAVRTKAAVQRSKLNYPPNNSPSSLSQALQHRVSVQAVRPLPPPPPSSTTPHQHQRTYRIECGACKCILIHWRGTTDHTRT